MSELSGPPLWGPHGWKFIHYITLGYPNYPTEENKNNYLIFFDTLKYVIPCSICGHNYREHLLENPLTLDILNDKLDFINWGIEMHNLVNMSNNKKIYTPEEGLEDMRHSFKGDCPGYTDISIVNKNEIKNKNNYIITILIIIIFILLVIIFIK
jgi:hypothetical protein